MKERTAIERVEDLKAKLEAVKGALPPAKFDDLKKRVEESGAFFERTIAAAEQDPAKVTQLMKTFASDEELVNCERELEAAMPAKAAKPRLGGSVLSRRSRMSAVAPETIQPEKEARGDKPVASSGPEKQTEQTDAEKKSQVRSVADEKNIQRLKVVAAERMGLIQETIDTLGESKSLYQGQLNNISKKLQAQNIDI